MREPPSVNDLEKCFNVFSILISIMAGIFTDPKGGRMFIELPL
jgi:hypothetical protein